MSETRKDQDPRHFTKVNDAGNNLQNLALLDFLALYTATQNDTTGNGSWEEQLSNIRSGASQAQKETTLTEAIRKLVFKMLSSSGILEFSCLSYHWAWIKVGIPREQPIRN